MKDFLEVVQTRKTIRSFADRDVTPEIIEKMIGVAVHAPTNCNQQLENFIVIRDPAIKERLIKEAACNTLIRRAPVVIVITYDGWNYKEAIQGGSLMLGHLLLAATYYGLQASPMNSFGSEKRVKKILGIPGSEVVCCFVNVGYPDRRADAAGVVPRRDISEVVHENYFDTTRVRPPFVYDPDAWTKEELAAHQKHYCRKTFLGKEMDLASEYERALVHEVLASRTDTEIIDYFSYDGSYVRHLPKTAHIQTVDLIPETAAYTSAAADLHGVRVESRVLGAGDAQRATLATMLFKRERIPCELAREAFDDAYQLLEVGGELVVIARTRHLFWSFYFAALKIVFGNDVRKTGLYTFFGPHAPVSRRTMRRELATAGFTEVTQRGYFAIPAFIDRLFEMVLQYIRSGGATYLHREVPQSMILAGIKKLLSIQGLSPAGRFGSVTVFICRK